MLCFWSQKVERQFYLPKCKNVVTKLEKKRDADVLFLLSFKSVCSPAFVNACFCVFLYKVAYLCDPFYFIICWPKVIFSLGILHLIT